MGTAFWCIVYVISPIDLMPELFLGPLGVGDDVIALVLAARAMARRRRLA